MANKTLSKKAIVEIVNKLPSPVAQHLKRCKKLAEFILENAKTKEWFLSLSLNEKELALAISFHDFGKAYVNPEYIYSAHCKKASDRNEYRTHVSKAVSYITEHSERYDVGTRGFDKYLYDVVSFHHEAYDGSGFPNGLKGEEIPFSARLCAVANYFDNLLNLGSVHEIDVAAAAEKVQEVSGTLLDPKLCEVLLADREVLKEFAEDTFQSDKRTRGSKYGIALRFMPQYTADTQELVGFDTQLLIRDSYFGYVPSKVFMPVASRNETVVQIDRLLRYRLLRQAELFIRHKTPFMRLSICQSLKSLSKKGYVPELLKVMRLYEVPTSALTVCVPEEFVLGSEPQAVSNVQELHNAGIRVSVDNFGDNHSSFALFETVTVDEIRLSPRLTSKMATSRTSYSIAEGLIGIAKNLGIPLVATEVADEPTQKILQSLGVNVLSGPVYGEQMTAYAVEKSLNVETEEGDGDE